MRAHPRLSNERRQKRLDALKAKKEKLDMLESLISMHEKQPKPNLAYIKDLKRRANEVRGQLTVLSLV